MFYVSMGGFVFQMVGASFLSEGGGGGPMGGLGFGGGGGFEKNRKMGCPPQLWETLLVVSLSCFVISACVHYQLLRLLCTFLKENQ